MIALKKRKSDTTPKAKPAKKGKATSTAAEGKEDKGQLLELRREFRESKADLDAALNRVKRAWANEDLQKKGYNDLKKKNDEELDDYDDLRRLKLATFNHVLAKWENSNENKEKGEISQLKNAFPVTLRI